MRTNTILMTVLSFIFLAGCVGSPKVDPMSAQITPADLEKIEIAPICQSSYKTETPRVAVVEFANNTTYGNMKASNTKMSGKSQTNSKSAAVVGVGVTPVGVVAGGVSAKQVNKKFEAQVDTFIRDITPKIGEYAQSAVENTIANVGGVEMFDRTNLQKLMGEQKFQMTMADPTTAVQLGKLAGVQYIVTGSVDNIATSYVEPVKDNNNASGWLGVAISAATVAANTQSGWNVNVEMTIKLLDVATGKIIVSKKVKGREIAGGNKNFNPDVAVQAAKKALGEAVDDLRPVFSEKFAQRGYIQQLRGNKTVALINLGTDNGIKSGDKFDVYEFIQIIDPLTNVATCNMSKIPVTLTASNQIQQKNCWLEVKGKPEQTRRLKLGAIIMRQKLSGQSIFKKMF